MKSLFTLLSLVLALFPLHTSAATVELSPLRLPDGSFTVTVFLTPTELLGAVEGTLRVEADVENIAIRIGESVVPLWIERPTLSGTEIRFAGMFPGGFSGLALPGTDARGPGPLFTVRFTDPDQQGEIALLQATAYRADEEGTPLALASTRAQYSTATLKAPPDVEDRTPPFLSGVEVVAGDTSGSGVPLLIFSALDKESGVAYAELRVEGGGWTRIESPHPLLPGDLGKRIELRVFDASGNYTTTVVVRGSLFGIPPALLYTLVGGAILLLLYFAVLLWRMRRTYGSSL